MKTTALRPCGKRDLRLKTFDLPEIQKGEILTTVVTDSLCLSSWREVNLDRNHKKVPDNVATNPIVIGHEFYGDTLAMGKKWQHKSQPGQRYVVQANSQLLNRPGYPGYSFPWVGGGTTYMVVPNKVMERDCLLAYDGETYLEGSLVEPLSCVTGALSANYHLQEGSYGHIMGIRPQGCMLTPGGTGPVGLLTIDYVLYGSVNPSLLAITDTDDDKLSYARKHYPPGPQTLIHYLNAAGATFDTLVALSGSHGFSNIFVLVPNEGLVTLTFPLLATDGCLNLFAGPQGRHFGVPISFYDMHYAFTHYVGTSGGNTDDMRVAVRLIGERKVQAAKVVVHILGLNVAGETTLELPAVGGGKELAYTGKHLPLTSLTRIQGQAPAATLACHQGIWPDEAEQYLLTHAGTISHD